MISVATTSSSNTDIPSPKLYLTKYDVARGLRSWPLGLASRRGRPGDSLDRSIPAIFPSLGRDA